MDSGPWAPTKFRTKFAGKIYSSVHFVHSYGNSVVWVLLPPTYRYLWLCMCSLSIWKVGNLSHVQWAVPHACSEIKNAFLNCNFVLDLISFTFLFLFLHHLVCVPMRSHASYTHTWELIVNLSLGKVIIHVYSFTCTVSICFAWIHHLKYLLNQRQTLLVILNYAFSFFS